MEDQLYTIREVKIDNITRYIVECVHVGNEGACAECLYEAYNDIIQSQESSQDTSSDTQCHS